MISALQACSFIDFPGRLAAVVFTQGCNLRCRYCHNPGLCPLPRGHCAREAETLRFLETRRGRLTGVVVTGGEPTLHDELPALLRAVRALGLAVKLDTNGTRPAVVRDLVARRLVDFVAVDVKLPPGAPSRWLCGADRQPEAALETLGRVCEGGVAHEARTTVLRGPHDVAGLIGIATALRAAGVGVWRLQAVRPAPVLDPSTPLVPPEPEVLSRALAAAAALGLDASVRGSPSAATRLPRAGAV